jgi:hypothetical protein
MAKVHFIQTIFILDKRRDSAGNEKLAGVPTDRTVCFVTDKTESEEVMGQFYDFIRENRINMKRLLHKDFSNKDLPNDYSIPFLQSS